MSRCERRAPPLVIAVDGPAAAGKGTLARALARRLDLAYLETGLLYRAVGRRLLDGAADPADAAAAERAARAVNPAELARPDLREEEVGEVASRVATLPGVRRALLDLQRRFAADPPGGKGGAVLDGRDIGTVVCPDAAVKLFLTAAAEERARRRHKELLDRGRPSIYARVLADVIARDERDGSRAVAPLRPAADAFVIDTTGMDAEAVLTTALHRVQSVVGPQRGR